MDRTLATLRWCCRDRGIAIRAIVPCAHGQSGPLPEAPNALREPRLCRAPTSPSASGEHPNTLTMTRSCRRIGWRRIPSPPFSSTGDIRDGLWSVNCALECATLRSSGGSGHEVVDSRVDGQGRTVGCRDCALAAIPKVARARRPRGVVPRGREGLATGCSHAAFIRGDGEPGSTLLLVSAFTPGDHMLARHQSRDQASLPRRRSAHLALSRTPPLAHGS